MRPGMQWRERQQWQEQQQQQQQPACPLTQHRRTPKRRCPFHLCFLVALLLCIGTPRPNEVAWASATWRHQVVRSGLLGLASSQLLPVPEALALEKKAIEPLPNEYWIVVYTLGTLVRDTMFDYISPSVLMRKKGGQEGKIAYEGLQIGAKIKDYEDKYVKRGPQNPLNEKYFTHPVYVKLNDLIGKLKEAGPEAGEDKKFLYARIKDAKDLLFLADKAGYLPEAV